MPKKKVHACHCVVSRSRTDCFRTKGKAKTFAREVRGLGFKARVITGVCAKGARGRNRRPLYLVRRKTGR
jgi:hypothetical protein